MGRVLNQKMYPCRIASNGVLHELHCITGPVSMCRITDGQIVSLVKNGRIVYEKNPKNLAEEVLLNTDNMLQHPFENIPLTREAIIDNTKVLNEKKEEPVQPEPVKVVVKEPIPEPEEVEEQPEILMPQQEVEEPEEMVEESTPESDEDSEGDSLIMDTVTEQKEPVNQYQYQQGKHGKKKKKNQRREEVVHTSDF